MKTVIESIQSTKLKLCVVEGCNNLKIKRGYCNAHYLRLYRHGDPLKGRSSPRIGCIVEDCKNKHIGKGYCKFHYERWIRNIPFDQEKQIKDSSRVCHIFDCNRKYYCKGYCRTHYDQFRNRTKSWNHGDLELYAAMNNVRIRDKHSCQWFGCKIKNKVHVHHIFPAIEYPELKYIEKYMICYCRYHHKLWHEKRGDVCARLIKLLV